jgi:hypothetical protein
LPPDKTPAVITWFWGQTLHNGILGNWLFVRASFREEGLGRNAMQGFTCGAGISQENSDSTQIRME